LPHVPTLAARAPELKIVIDHLGKPPVATGELEPWASQLAAAAECPNVFAKVSGLMAVFGAPRRQPDHADEALATAVEIEERLRSHDSELEIGIGPTPGASSPATSAGPAVRR
jgi:predicted TIM-barrel fold metal-dependent hydrolase